MVLPTRYNSTKLFTAYWIKPYFRVTLVIISHMTMWSLLELNPIGQSNRKNYENFEALKATVCTVKSSWVVAYLTDHPTRPIKTIKLGRISWCECSKNSTNRFVELSNGGWSEQDSTEEQIIAEISSMLRKFTTWYLFLARRRYAIHNQWSGAIGDVTHTRTHAHKISTVDTVSQHLARDRKLVIVTECSHST